LLLFFFNHPAPTDIYTLSLHDALPIYEFTNIYHLTAGALFHLGTDFQFRPSLLVTYSESLRPQAEASAMFFVKEVFGVGVNARRSEEHTSELQSRENLVCRLLLEKKKR